MAFIVTKAGHRFDFDDDDLDLVSQYTWRSSEQRSGAIYAWTTKKKNKIKTCILLHRLIINAPKDMLVDHIDRNTLNNHKSNLRLDTKSQNKTNSLFTRGTSIYRGVYFHKRIKKWSSTMTVDRKKYHLGYFPSEEEAFKAYMEASLKLHGEFSPYFLKK